MVELCKKGLKSIKMNKMITKAALLVMAFGFISLATFSCRKEGDTVAKVLVIDTSGAPVAGAMVRLYPEPTIGEHGAIIVDDTMYTDGLGYATFNYSDNYNLGQAGVFVLNIEVNSGDSIYGTGIIKVEQEETSQETVIAQ